MEYVELQMIGLNLTFLIEGNLSLSMDSILTRLSLFHMKITARITKSSHQDCGPCYLHLPVFLYIHSPPLWQKNHCFPH